MLVRRSRLNPNEVRSSTETAPAPLIESRILLIRGKKVLLDSDLAVLDQVETKRINEAVRRNCDRFPEDSILRLTVEEDQTLRSQIATSKENRGGCRYLPCAFTEQGIAMLLSVLTSKRAVEVNIAIMRTFCPAPAVAGHARKTGTTA